MTGREDLKLALRFLRSINTDDPKLDAEIELVAERIEKLLDDDPPDCAPDKTHKSD